MRKILVFTTLSLTLFTVSCKKDYSCDCTTTTITTTEEYDPFFDTWETTTTTTTADITHNFQAKKKDASSICSGYNSSTSFLGVSSNTVCSLK